MPDFYGTIAGFRAYHLARNHDIAVMTDDETTAALLVASEWLDSRYRSQFGGYIGTDSRNQPREWPRISAYDVRLNLLEGVPREIENATYEAAAIQGATPGALSQNFTPRKYDSVSISGAVSVVYAAIQSVADAQTQYAIISEILSPVLTATGSGNSNIGNSIRG